VPLKFISHVYDQIKQITSFYVWLDSSKFMSDSITTLSILNYKSFQEYLSLTKIIERNTKICNIKWVYYENITKKETNDT